MMLQGRQVGSVFVVALVFLLLTAFVAIAALDAGSLSRMLVVNGQLQEDARQKSEGIVNALSVQAVERVSGDLSLAPGAVLCAGNGDVRLACHPGNKEASHAFGRYVQDGVVSYHVVLAGESLVNAIDNRLPDTLASEALLSRRVDVQGSYRTAAVRGLQVETVSSLRVIVPVAAQADPVVADSADHSRLLRYNAIPVRVNYNGSVVPAMVFAASHDFGSDDAASLKGVSDGRAGAIFIVNAHTQELIWKASGEEAYGNDNSHFYHPGMRYAIPSAVRPVDADADGVMDRLYVGDAGGNIWRGDFPACRQGLSCKDEAFREKHWRMNLLASLSNAGEQADVGFFQPPAVVFTRDALGPYEAIVIASGDREQHRQIIDDNRVFLLKDRGPAQGELEYGTLLRHQLADVSACVTAGLPDCDSLLEPESLRYGWSFRLGIDHGVDGIRLPAGEKAFSSPLVVDGEVYLGTQVPALAAMESPAEWLNAGFAFFYKVSLKDGTAVNGNAFRQVRMGSGTDAYIRWEGRSIRLAGAVPLAFVQGRLVADMSANDDKRVDRFVAGEPRVEPVFWRQDDGEFVP